MAEAWERLRTLWAELDDVERSAGVLEWDQLVGMPPGGAAARGLQLASLRRLAHQRLTGREMAAAIDAAGSDPDTDPSWLEAARRRYTREAGVPASLVEARSRAASEGYGAWLRAREARDFRPFAPALSRVLDLTRQYADAIGWSEDRYDALVSVHEPGLTTAVLAKLFADLRDGLVALAGEIAQRPPLPRDALRVRLPEAVQEEAARQAVAAIGYDFSRGRLDRSVHPFSTSFGPGDCRITTRFDAGDFGVAFFAALHEAGHALYEQGIPEAYARGALGEACSSAVHESQSRLWENLVGRGLFFWQWFLPLLVRLAPEYGAFRPEQVYRAANNVAPSTIRVEADEVTYNLHVALRFRLERALLSADLAVADLPAAWADGMRDEIGASPVDDLDGVLQDIHWSEGLFGYFPSYALGNVLAAQWMDAAQQALGGLPAQIAAGEFGPLLAFLRERIHRRGAALTPEALVREVTGGPISAGPLLTYLRGKYEALYGL